MTATAARDQAIAAAMAAHAEMDPLIPAPDRFAAALDAAVPTLLADLARTLDAGAGSEVLYPDSKYWRKVRQDTVRDLTEAWASAAR